MDFLWENKRGDIYERIAILCVRELDEGLAMNGIIAMRVAMVQDP